MATEHPSERVKKPNGQPYPMLACPKCIDTPGLEFDSDGGGGFYTDCHFCHGTAEVPDVAKLAAKHREKAAGEQS